MEQQLRANDHKPGWKGEFASNLFPRIAEEADELWTALVRHSKRLSWGDGWVMETDTEQRVGSEAADVANFAMMIADVCGALPSVPTTDGWALVPIEATQEMVAAAYSLRDWAGVAVENPEVQLGFLSAYRAMVKAAPAYWPLRGGALEEALQDVCCEARNTYRSDERGGPDPDEHWATVILRALPARYLHALEGIARQSDAAACGRGK